MILVGILIAASIIAGVTALEQNKIITSPSSATVTSSTTVTSTTSIISSVTSSVTAPIQTGILAAQITDPPDPPNAPAGTTHIYIEYSDIEAHTTVQNNNSVWFTVAKGGIVDLYSILNIGLTLGSSEVSSGVFDQARFDIVNATVTFGGINYTASVPLNQIIVPFSNGGAVVKPNASAGFVIDVTPTVLALSNGGVPSFEIVTATQGVSIPSQSWTESLAATGSKIQNITSQSWWKGPTPIGDNLAEEVPSEIYPTSLLVILNNTGNTSVTISGLNILTSGTQGTQNNATLSTSTIISTITTVTTITEVTTITGNSSGESTASLAAPIPPVTSNSNSSQSTVATFLILTDGSVIQPSPNSAPIPSSQIGLTIKSNQVVVLLYLGTINTLNSPNPPYAQQNIIGGQEYVIQIVTPFGSSIEFTVNASYPS
jgi:hypothetical protein